MTGRTWGGCAEVVQWILTAGRFPADPAVLQGGILLLETSEELISAREFGWIVRSLGERGLLEAVDAVLVARSPTSTLEIHHTSQQRAARRAEQRDVAIETVHRYNSDAIVLVGVPFGHTRPNGSSLTEAKSPSIAQRRNCGRTTPEAPSHVALGVSGLSSRSICGKRASECV